MVESNAHNPPSDISPHPEEIKATFDLRIGESVSLQGSARITPAGVIATGITVSLMLLALGYLLSNRRRW